MRPITVRQLNLFVRSLLDGEPRLSDVAVIGEISNFKNHYSSGHWYFTLKDNDATVRCVMFKGNAQKVKFAPSDGMQVILRARASVYEKDGQFQLYAEEMLPAGDGGIALAFEQIKQKLASEGLFDEQNKRKLPAFPNRIAVVTSDTGAAVRDIINVITRRYPLCDIMLCPVAVQGEQAVPDMLDALERIYSLSSVDLIIIGRGGGSVEDLWAFNSEALARKIYESPIPVISAVGHETDFTICDFVSDLRAPTPSAAAELAVPDVKDLKAVLSDINLRLLRSLEQRYKLESTRLSSVMSSLVFRKPESIVDDRALQADKLSERLEAAVGKRIDDLSNSFSMTVSKLDALSPIKVLSRGFAAVQNNGVSVKSITQLNVNDNLSVRFSDGVAECNVKEII